MVRYHIWTIGCQMNKAESERLENLFARDGMTPTENAEDADFILLNTCVVRKHAEDRVVNKVHTLKRLKKANPDLTLAITGCWVDSNQAQMKKDFPFIDHFFRAGEKPPWLDNPAWQHVTPHNPQVTAYVPIIQGCNNFCAYCIVPYRRGPEKSRPVSEIVCETRELVKRGVREVTLLGQNVDSYGHDLKDRPGLADLLVELDDIEGLWRIRFLTNHPKDMSPRLIDTIAKLGKVCESLNIPVQAGSNEILKLMRRGYSAEDYTRLIESIREKIPGVSLSNDVIVGFPTETEAQFQQTVDLLTGLRFDMVHVAAYSPRPGTIAAREYEDDVPQEEKKRRVAIIETLQEKIATEINAELQGQDVEVLVEGKQKGKWYGRTGTDKIIFFSSQENWQGKLATIRIIRTSPWSLQGNVVS